MPQLQYLVSYWFDIKLAISYCPYMGRLKTRWTAEFWTICRGLLTLRDQLDSQHLNCHKLICPWCCVEYALWEAASLLMTVKENSCVWGSCRYEEQLYLFRKNGSQTCGAYFVDLGSGVAVSVAVVREVIWLVDRWRWGREAGQSQIPAGDSRSICWSLRHENGNCEHVNRDVAEGESREWYKVRSSTSSTNPAVPSVQSRAVSSAFYKGTTLFVKTFKNYSNFHCWTET